MYTLNMQVLRNLHSQVIELNSQLNLLKRQVFLSERELEEYQFAREEYEVIHRTLDNFLILSASL